MSKFNYIDKINEVSFYIEGWKSYITVQYRLHMISKKTYLMWKVKGTEKIFEIDLLIVNEKHGHNYEEHFKLTLTKLREDLVEWKNQNFPDAFMKKYWDIYKNLIYY